MPEPLDLDALEALEREATPPGRCGWHTHQFGEQYPSGHSPAWLSQQNHDDLEREYVGDLMKVAVFEYRTDLDFYLAARNALPALIATARRVEEAERLLRRFIDHDPCCYDHHDYWEWEAP